VFTAPDVAISPDDVAEDERGGADDDDNKCTTLWPPALTPLSWRLMAPALPCARGVCIHIRACRRGACHIYALHLPRAYQNKHEFHVVRRRSLWPARVDKTSPQVQQFRRKRRTEWKGRRAGSAIGRAN